MCMCIRKYEYRVYTFNFFVNLWWFFSIILIYIFKTHPSTKTCFNRYCTFSLNIFLHWCPRFKFGSFMAPNATRCTARCGSRKRKRCKMHMSHAHHLPKERSKITLSKWTALERYKQMHDLPPKKCENVGWTWILFNQQHIPVHHMYTEKPLKFTILDPPRGSSWSLVLAPQVTAQKKNQTRFITRRWVK